MIKYLGSIKRNISIPYTRKYRLEENQNLDENGNQQCNCRTDVDILIEIFATFDERYKYHRKVK